MKTISIVIPSLLENIRIIESFIDNAKEQFELSEDLYGNITIAVTEAVSNSIKHGNLNNASKIVKLTLLLEERLIRFYVEDEGMGFDAQALPDPTAPENVEKIYGRGVFLMRSLADEVNFEDNGRRVELSFRLPT